MQFHQSFNISVTTSCWPWWEIEVQPTPWYSLSKLPLWTTIVRDSSSQVIFYLYYWWQSICTISAYWDVERWYALEGCTINRWWDKFIVRTTPIELESWDVIWFTFEQVNTVLWFYSDSVWQWYDSNNNIVPSAKLPVWLYTISSFTQATSNSYALTISWDSTYIYYYKWSSPITIDYIEINWNQELIPYPIVSWDYLRVKYTETPWVSLASETGLWHWEDENWKEISFIPAQSGRTSIDFSVYDYDSNAHYVKIRIEWGSTSEYNSSYITYCCSKDSHLTDVEITDLYEDYSNNHIYARSSSSFNVPTWYYLIWNMSPIYGVIEKWKQSSSNILQDVANNVSCLSVQGYWELQPYQVNYLFFSRETWYYCWIFTTQQQQNSTFAVVVFDRDWYVDSSECFSYNSNPFWIPDFTFINRENLMMSNWSPMDYKNLQSSDIKLYSNTQLVQSIMEYFHKR